MEGFGIYFPFFFSLLPLDRVKEIKLHHSSFKVSTAPLFTDGLVWYNFVFLSLCFHEDAVASRSNPSCSVSHVTLIISTLKWLKVEPHSSLVREQTLLQLMYIVHGPHLLPPTRSREHLPDLVSEVIWGIFFMFGEGNSSAYMSKAWHLMFGFRIGSGCGKHFFDINEKASAFQFLGISHR